jgi:hypothetical protein
LVPVGAVSFLVDGLPAPGCQMLPVDDDDPACALAGLSPGDHEVRAIYSGAPLFDPSQGAMTQTIEGEPTCVLREVRGRMLVFRGKQAVRLVARYRAATPGEVIVRFYARKGRARRGALLGTLDHAFSAEGLDRIVKRMPAKQMRRVRRGHGFIVEFDVRGDPVQCARRFSRSLTIRREVARQQVWFQSDSLRSALPAGRR